MNSRDVQIFRYDGPNDRESVMEWITLQGEESGLAGMGDAGARWVASQLLPGDFLLTYDGAHFMRFREIPFKETLWDEELEEKEQDNPVASLAPADDTALRLEALSLAVKNDIHFPVTTARYFLRFLKGEDE